MKKLQSYIIESQFDDIDKLIIAECNIESYKNSPALKYGILESIGIFNGCKELTEYIFTQLKNNIDEQELKIDVSDIKCNNKFFDLCFLHIKHEDNLKDAEAGYYSSDGHSDYNEIRYDVEAEKFKFIEIVLKFSKYNIDSLYSLIMHELIHAYDDYIHIKKYGFESSLYMRNERNKYHLVKVKNENDSAITQVFKDFMYFLNKSEQTAYIGQMNTEISGTYDNIKDIINDLKETSVFFNYKLIKLNFNAIVNNKKYNEQFCDIYRKTYDTQKTNESIIKELNNKYNKCWKKFINHLYHIAEDHLLKNESITKDTCSRITVFETKGDAIDEQWLNDNKPVMTQDGRQVIITSIDRKQVPNIIQGKVKMGTKLFKYEWLDDGTCQKALDRFGNPKNTDYADKLVKAI